MAAGAAPDVEDRAPRPAQRRAVEAAEVAEPAADRQRGARAVAPAQREPAGGQSALVDVERRRQRAHATRSPAAAVTTTDAEREHEHGARAAAQRIPALPRDAGAQANRCPRQHPGQRSASSGAGRVTSVMAER